MECFVCNTEWLEVCIACVGSDSAGDIDQRLRQLPHRNDCNDLIGLRIDGLNRVSAQFAVL